MDTIYKINPLTGKFDLVNNEKYLKESLGLKLIYQNGKRGWRLAQTNNTYYGPIGNYAVDLSIAQEEDLSLNRELGALGDHSFASGKASVAKNPYSTVFGLECIADGYYSTSIGKKNVSKGNASLTIGSLCETDGHLSTAIGYDNKIVGNVATIIGRENNITANLGKYPSAVSITLGYRNKTTGGHCVVIGSNNNANGLVSKEWCEINLIGNYLIGKDGETIIGTGNTDSSEINRSFVVGIGSEYLRKDGLVVYKDGRICAPHLEENFMVDPKSLITLEKLNSVIAVQEETIKALELRIQALENANQ